ncbi:TetR/AcrR family transcriptional regulator [Janthinobacterium agaricidamnosum]|uniref:Bacterial regulatory s, tetR family protein n=1 Tax=Janthinobacterium agaricidamnosum NBRC 102515 = DSM 9628 TaxID=1349767 RepID=W0V178_9BURK|nr:TetR/AcrR family transcriptional regulator [Janthinobacterium agaricidamnosum]CDG81626.1 bacterial regulatory s, tetR family protein [Janthinobacterium agaricidamnosum NBRC 102515 = DSM 9628]
MLHKAMLLFWEKGYQATAMSDLVACMGIQSASIYSAFGSKERLFNEVVELYCRSVGSQIWGPLQQHAQARDGIEVMLRTSARLMQASAGPGGCLVNLGAIEGGAADPVTAKLRALRHRSEQQIVARIDKAKHDGEIAATADAGQVGMFYAAIQQSIALRARDGASAAQLTQLIDMAMSVWPRITGK